MILRAKRLLSNLQPSRGKGVFRTWLLLAACAWLSACSNQASHGGDKMTAEARISLARQRYGSGQPVVLAAAWNSQDGEFLAGAQLAAEEINAEGGINGHVLKLETLDEQPFVSGTAFTHFRDQGRYRNEPQLAGTTMAKTILRNPEITAVIGHSTDSTILPAMLAYEQSGVLFFGSGSNDSRIRWSSAHLYFQLQPQNTLLAKVMTKRMKDWNWDKIYFIYEATRHNEQFVELLKTDCASANINFGGAVAIMPDASSNSSTMRMQQSIAALRAGDVDALVLIASSDLAAHTIREARTLGLLQPFIIKLLSNPISFIKRVGPFGENARLVTLGRDGYQIDEFHKRFAARFPNQKADVSAEFGYDSVRLYADAVATADSTDPTLVANVLHYKLTTWHGLLGNYTFVDREVQNVKYSVQRLVRQKDGELAFVKDSSVE